MILVFRRYPSKDLAEFGTAYTVKNIPWMGIVCTMNGLGMTLAIWHGPN